MPNNKRELLIDANVLYSLSFQNVKDLNDLLGQNVVISAGLITPFELLSGLSPTDNDSQLRRRLNAIIKYQKLHIHLYEQTPQEIIEVAFGIRQDSSSPTPIIEALTLVSTCKDLTKLRDLAKYHPIIIHLRNEANRVSEVFSDAISMTTQHHRDITNAQFEELEVPQTGQAFTDFVNLLKASGDLHIYSLIALATRAGIVEEDAIQGEGLFERYMALAESLRELYDQSLDMYIDGFVEYRVDKNVSGGNSHRNDSFDLDHLFYLRKNDEAQILVTGDQGLYDSIAVSHPKRVMTVKDLQAMISSGVIANNFEN